MSDGCVSKLATSSASGFCFGTLIGALNATWQVRRLPTLPRGPRPPDPPPTAPSPCTSPPSDPSPVVRWTAARARPNPPRDHLHQPDVTQRLHAQDFRPPSHRIVP